MLLPPKLAYQNELDVFREHYEKQDFQNAALAGENLIKKVEDLYGANNNLVRRYIKLTAETYMKAHDCERAKKMYERDLIVIESIYGQDSLVANNSQMKVYDLTQKILNKHPRCDKPQVGQQELIAEINLHFKKFLRHLNSGEYELAGPQGEQAIKLSKTVKVMKESTLNSYYTYTQMAYRKANNQKKVDELEQDRLAFFSQKTGSTSAQTGQSEYEIELQSLKPMKVRADNPTTNLLNIRAKRAFANFYLKHNEFEKAEFYQQQVFDFMHSTMEAGYKANNGFAQYMTALTSLGGISKQEKKHQTDIFNIGLIKYKLNKKAELLEVYEKSKFRACEVMNSDSTKSGVPKELSNLFCEEVLHHYANLFAASSNHQKAKELYLELLSTHQKSATYRLLAFSISDKHDFTFSKQAKIYGSSAFNHMFDSKTYSITEKHYVYEYLANMKGKLLDIEESYKAAARTSKDPEIQKLYQNYMEVSAHIERQIQAGQGIAPDVYKSLIEKKLSSSLALKRKFVEKNSNFYDPLRINEIKKNLEPEEIYIDIIKVVKKDHIAQKSQSTSYYVVLIDQKGLKDITKLNTVQDIDKLVSAHHYLINTSISQKIEPSQSRLNDISSKIYELSLGRVDDILSNYTSLLINADGAFESYPVSILKNNDRYLVEDFEITYISSLRELNSRSSQKYTINQVNVYANPAYDTKTTTSTAFSRSVSNLSNNIKQFTPLLDTEVEALGIQKALQDRSDVTLFLNDEANEINLYQSVNKQNEGSILHIASHGFFLPKLQNTEYTDKNNFISSDYLKNEDPLSRSGLALSGANVGIKNASDEGILTARKLINFNMEDINLVVLSACNSGSGDVHDGEGVYGLKRAIQVAGVDNIIVSNWAIPSHKTTELMTMFYRNLADSGDINASLRQAQLEIMKKTRNPFNWGAFIHVGSSSNNLRFIKN